MNGVGPVATANPAGAGTPAAASPPKREVKPNLDQVRQKAYDLYQARTRAGKPGDPGADWDQAERELRSHSAR